MNEMKCWFLSSALQGSWLHAGHLLAAFQSNQKEVQVCRVKDLKLLLIHWFDFSPQYLLPLK